MFVSGDEWDLTSWNNWDFNGDWMWNSGNTMGYTKRQSTLQLYSRRNPERNIGEFIDGEIIFEWVGFIAMTKWWLYLNLFFLNDVQWWLMFNENCTTFTWFHDVSWEQIKITLIWCCKSFNILGMHVYIYIYHHI